MFEMAGRTSALRFWRRSCRGSNHDEDGGPGGRPTGRPTAKVGIETEASSAIQEEAYIPVELARARISDMAAEVERQKVFFHDALQKLENAYKLREEASHEKYQKFVAELRDRALQKIESQKRTLNRISSGAEKSRKEAEAALESQREAWVRLQEENLALMRRYKEEQVKRESEKQESERLLRAAHEDQLQKLKHHFRNREEELLRLLIKKDEEQQQLESSLSRTKAEKTHNENDHDDVRAPTSQHEYVGSEECTVIENAAPPAGVSTHDLCPPSDSLVGLSSSQNTSQRGDGERCESTTLVHTLPVPQDISVSKNAVPVQCVRKDSETDPENHGRHSSLLTLHAGIEHSVAPDMSVARSTDALPVGQQPPIAEDRAPYTELSGICDTKEENVDADGGIQSSPGRIAAETQEGERSHNKETLDLWESCEKDRGMTTIAKEPERRVASEEVGSTSDTEGGEAVGNPADSREIGVTQETYASNDVRMSPANRSTSVQVDNKHMTSVTDSDISSAATQTIAAGTPQGGRIQLIEQVQMQMEEMDTLRELNRVYVDALHHSQQISAPLPILSAREKVEESRFPSLSEEHSSEEDKTRNLQSEASPKSNKVLIQPDKIIQKEMEDLREMCRKQGEEISLLRAGVVGSPKVVKDSAEPNEGSSGVLPDILDGSAQSSKVDDHRETTTTDDFVTAKYLEDITDEPTTQTEKPGKSPPQPANFNAESLKATEESSASKRSDRDKLSRSKQKSAKAQVPSSNSASADRTKLKNLEKKIKEDRIKINQLEAALAKAEARAAASAGKNSEDAEKKLAAKKAAEKERKLSKAVAEAEKELSRQQELSAKEIRDLKDRLQETSTELEKAITEKEELQKKTWLLGELQDEVATLRQKADALKSAEDELEHKKKEVATLEVSYKNEQTLRRRYFNQLEDMKGKIRVFARCRPMSGSEKERGCATVVKFKDETTLELETAKGPREFTYDCVFSPASTQEDIFEDAKNLVQSTFDGYNVCVFAYGQTGSGKTFTMTGGGSEETKGLIPRTTKHLFEMAAQNAKDSEISISAYMLELYNDSLVDLFRRLDVNGAKDDPQAARLDIKKNNDGQIFVKGAIIKEAADAPTLLQLFEKGNSYRKVAGTKMNAESSRSHLIFSIMVKNYNKTTKKTYNGKLSLVDLAGSERASKTGASAERMKEAQAINKSLSALGDVISALSNNEKFIPYRNNKLTQIMQDSLGGNAKTLMFVNISPADYNAEETQTSLSYASRVKLITNQASKAAESEEISRLKSKLKQYADKFGDLEE